MLDSSSRLPVAQLSPQPPQDWEETTFTRPMRSPFVDAKRTRTPPPLTEVPPAVDVSLEESALFDAPVTRKMPHAALRRVTTAPPPRRSTMATPVTDEETTSKNSVNPELLSAIRDRDSFRMRQAIALVDLGKTMEEPVLDVCEEHLERR